MLKLSKNFVRKIQGDVEIMEHSDLGIISMRYRLKKELFNVKLQRLIGKSIPLPNQILYVKDWYLAWMSTDELWFLSETEITERMFDKLAKIESSLVNIISINLSASRTAFSLNGKQWRNILSKGSPADLSKNAFKPGNIRRTRLGLVPVAILSNNLENATVICNRSVRDYVYHWLEVSSKKGSIPDFH